MANWHSLNVSDNQHAFIRQNMCWILGFEVLFQSLVVRQSLRRKFVIYAETVCY